MGKKISLFATTLPTNIVAADPSNWPVEIIYDPDKRGKPISSLGVHERWNDSFKRQHSKTSGWLTTCQDKKCKSYWCKIFTGRRQKPRYGKSRNN